MTDGGVFAKATGKNGWLFVGPHTINVDYIARIEGTHIFLIYPNGESEWLLLTDGSDPVFAAKLAGSLRTALQEACNFDD